MMRKRTVAILGACALALSACSSPTGTGSDVGDNGLRKVSVGMIPILPTAALEAGIEQGFFEDEGLEVEIDLGQGGAALVPAVFSGDVHFATGNVVSLLQAREKGLDIRMVSGYTYDPEDGAHALLVADGSAIDSPDDLEGKTVAVNTLTNIGDLVTRGSVEAAGGDPQAVEFAEMNFADMLPALTSGQVDAMWTPEPFLTIATEADAEVLTFPGADVLPGGHTMGLFASGEMVDSDPDLVASMTRALDKTLEFAQENPQAVRSAASNVIELDAQILKSVQLETFSAAVEREKLEALGDLMQHHGHLSQAADVDGLLQSVPEKNEQG